MPSRDQYGNEIYSQGEYEHLNFIGEPFSGFVEGIGYTYTETIIIGYPHNASRTHFMFDIKLISYSFDIGDLVYSNDSSITDYQKNSDTYPDRSDYLRIPNISKFDYGDMAWYDPTRVAVFTDNVLINLINPVIDLANDAIVPTQILYNEGFNAFWDNEKRGAKDLVNGSINYLKDTYDYTANTPFSKQLTDFGNDLSNPHRWEDGVSLALGLYYGARISGLTPTKTRLGIPQGAIVPKLSYPLETTSDGFLFRGFEVKAPFNIPVQRFEYINPNANQFWGLRIGSGVFQNRFFAAIKVEWNPLTNYNIGVIPKNSNMKFGIIGPQYPRYKYFGGSFQFIIKSEKVIIKSTKTVN